MEPELLARIQFAFTAGFHFLFPPLSIGLGVFLVVVQGFAYKLKTPEWRALADYWTKIFGEERDRQAMQAAGYTDAVDGFMNIPEGVDDLLPFELFSENDTRFLKEFEAAN